MSDTPTPRTDAKALEMLKMFPEGFSTHQPAKFVRADFARDLERKLAIATLALEDIAAIHADHDWPETYAGRVKATANAALEAIGPHVVEFCGGETPELTAAYDRLEQGNASH